MANYKGVVSRSWIIFCFTAVVPTVVSQTKLSSSTQQFCPEATIVITCTTTGSSILAWMSEEFIGSGSQLEFRSVDRIGTTQRSSSNPDTVATLTAYNNEGTILTSTLRIVTKSTTSNVNVSCINVVLGETNFTIIPLAAVPGVPQNARAMETSPRIDNNCIILVEWDPPASSNGSDIDRYIVYVPSRSITDTESSTITVLSVPNCRDADVILVAAVNRFGCVGPNSPKVQPNLFFDGNAQTTEGGSTTVTITPIEDRTTSTTVVVVVIVGTVIFLISSIMFIVGLVLFCIYYKKTGKKIRAGDEEVRIALQDFQGHTFVYVIQYHLEELYEALKSQSDGKIRVAAKALSRTLKRGSSNKNVKEALKNCLERIQSESGEDVRKALDKMDNIITTVRNINEAFKKAVHDLLTEAQENKHGLEKTLGDLIKIVDGEEVQPDQIIGSLLTLCEKLPTMEKVKTYYQGQSKYDFDGLGTERDRVSVPIWIQDTLDDGWKGSLRKAVEAISEAAPGLLLLTTDKKRAIIHVQTIDKEEAYTEGNILMRSIPENSGFVAKIYLGKWEDDRKKGISIHELLHALGFHHELQRSDAPSYVFRCDSGKEITINKNWLDLTRFDPRSLSIMRYPCEKKTKYKEHPEVPVWLLKADQAQENWELSELDKVGLNLVYPPCVITTDENVKYIPIHSDNGMYYCGRQVMLDYTYPHENNAVTDCGPNNGPNCPACRTIKSPKVKAILRGGRWQGMTGLVYCARLFAEPQQINTKHDGMCGVNSGPACPDCNVILDEEM